jgi:hypothetical protein
LIFDIVCGYAHHMTTFYDQILAKVSQQPTSIPGLKWFPSLEPHVSNDQDWPPFGFPNSAEVSDLNLQAVSNVIQQLGHRCQCIVEIGVDRNGSNSFTRVFLGQKPANCVYLGVDIEPKPHLHDPSRKSYFLQTNSHNRTAIVQQLQILGVSEIDCLMIDGWHSVNTAVNDWHLSSLVSSHGVVIMHDTNAHPGPVALYDAVDECQWNKIRLFVENDMGLALFSRKISQ